LPGKQHNSGIIYADDSENTNKVKKFDQCLFLKAGNLKQNLYRGFIMQIFYPLLLPSIYTSAFGYAFNKYIFHSGPSPFLTLCE
jgi:hypothetical protein